MRGDARSDKGDSIAVASWSERGGDVMRRDAMHQQRGVIVWRRGANDASQHGQQASAPGQRTRATAPPGSTAGQIGTGPG